MNFDLVIFFILVGLAILILVIRAFTVLLHELAHALPFIWFTGESVTIYIGSFGDARKSFRVPLGKLQIWLRYNPLFWQRGICFPPEQSLSANKQIISIACGPLISVILAIPAFYFSFHFDSHGAIKFVTVILLCSSTLDLIVNIIPYRIYENGKSFGTDGLLLINLFRYKNFHRRQAKAIRLCEQEKYRSSVRLLNDLVKRRFADSYTVRCAIWANVSAREYNVALLHHERLKEKYTIEPADYHKLGIILCRLDRIREGLEAFDQLLSLKPDDVITLCNKGYGLVLLNRSDEALSELDQAVALAPEYSYAYSYRALARMRSGDAAGGLADIEKAFSLDPDDAYAYRHLGIYYLDRGNKQQALENFAIARSLDGDTHLIDELLKEAEESTGPQTH